MVAAGTPLPAHAAIEPSAADQSLGAQRYLIPKPGSLRLVVRHAGYAQQRRATLKSFGQDSAIVSAPFAPGLELVLVSDSVLASTVIDSDMAHRIGLSPADAMALGRRQVLMGLPAVPRPDDIDEGVITSPKIDYIASLLLADGWDELNSVLGERLIVAVPSDDQIVIATASDAHERRKIAAYVGQMHREAARSVSAHLYARKNGAWILADNG